MQSYKVTALNEQIYAQCDPCGEWNFHVRGNAIFDVSIQDNLKHFRRGLFCRLKAFDDIIPSHQACSRISPKIRRNFAQKVGCRGEASISVPRLSEVLTIRESFSCPVYNEISVESLLHFVPRGRQLPEKGIKQTVGCGRHRAPTCDKHP